MPEYLQAGLWGLLGGSALILGAAIGYFARAPKRLIAAVMAFGSGVLISALSFDLMDEAFRQGGLDSAAIGFLAGAAAFTGANFALARYGARKRKRSEGQTPASAGGGAAIAVGALLDGIPESIVIGVSLLAGKGVSLVAVVAVFLSNVPEGLSSASGMRQAGRGVGYVMGLWTGIALASGAASLVGYSLFSGVSPDGIAITEAVAAGAILAMLVDTMIPEAFEVAHDFAGLITVTGFLAAFGLSKLAG
jgi:ZIP family zinc transporter